MRTTLADWCRERGDDTLLKQWDSGKNTDFTPETVSYGSKKKLFWRCERGHSWQATVCSRTAGAGCPYCAGKKVADGGNDLATRYPDLAAEWHPAKNGGLTPSDVTPGTHRKVYWRCKNGHEWLAEIKSRTQGSGCPVCTNRVVLQGFNDLATMHPNLAAEWHPAKNGELTPSEVLPGTDRRVWWRCRENSAHEWQAAISSRVCGGNDCPFCVGKKIVGGENDLATAYPDIAAEWDTAKNGGLTPDMAAPQSNKKTWWRCPLGHSYAATISSRTTRGYGCPYCAGRRVMPGFNDLATKDPLLAKQWYQPKNASLTPEMVTCGSSKKVYWKCSLGHIWPAVISSRATGRKCGCPVCAGKTKANFAARYQSIMEQERLRYRPGPSGMEAMGK